MQYLLMIYSNEAGMQAAPKEALTQMSAAYGAYTEAMKKAGVIRGGERLRPTSEATTVRVKDGKTQVLDGPIRRHQGTARRLLPDRRARPRRRAVMGGALPRRLDRHAGGPADLADADNDGPRRGARCRRGRRAPQLRQAGRVSGGAHARRRGGRGCAVRGVRGCARRLAGERHSRKVPRRGCSPSRAARRSTRRGAGKPARPPRIRSGMMADGTRSHRRERERYSGSAPRADVRLRASGDRAGIRAPLILQTILGFDAATIASAFLVAPATMGQRLARAKQKITRAGVPFRVPERADLGERLDAVLAAIYAAFAEGWTDPAGTEARRRNLAEEGIWLGRLVVSLLPDEPEALGLLALMLFAEARRGARRNADGDYVPLAEQDTAVGRRADRRGRGAAAAREPHGRDRPLSARSRRAVRACGAAAHRARRLGGDRETLRGAVRADRLAGGRDQPRGRARRDARAPLRALRRSTRCRTMRGSPTINPIGRRAPGCWRGWETPTRPTAPTNARSVSKAIPPSAASCNRSALLSGTSA